MTVHPRRNVCTGTETGTAAAFPAGSRHPAQPAAGSKAGGSAAARTAAGKLREKCSAQSGRARKAGRSDERHIYYYGW